MCCGIKELHKKGVPLQIIFHFKIYYGKKNKET